MKFSFRENLCIPLSTPKSNPQTHTPPKGWRYQIPPLLQAGYRVVCPDIMGFGRTDAPPVSPPPSNEGIEYYSFKRAAEDIKELARQLGTEQIILGGHDWVSRFALTLPIECETSTLYSFLSWFREGGTRY